MEVKDVMRTNVLVVQSGATVMEAVNLMMEHKITCVLVLDKEAAVGIITETDILRKIVAQKKDADLMKVDDIMSSPLISATSKTPLSEACQLMSKNKIKKLPIVDNKRLVGLITAADIIANEPAHVQELAELVLKPTKPIGG